MRAFAVVGLALLAIGTSLVASASGSRTSPVARCASGAVAATIDGKRACLRRGQRCRLRLDRQYHRYGFHCHTGRLTGGPEPGQPAPGPPAGRIVATIPAPSWGGVEVGAGSVWIANATPHTVTRVDPDTNEIVATIRVGDATVDPFKGPGRLAYGHGTLWVLDGASSCSCVHRIDPATNRIDTTIPLGTSPTQGRAAPLGIVVRPEAVWIALRHGNEDALDGAVVRVDPITNKVVAVIGAGSNPEFGGPTRLATASGSVWTGVPSSRSVVRIDPVSNSVVASIAGLSCGEGDLVADDSGGVWVADCTAIRRIDPATNSFSQMIEIPGDRLSAGARGMAIAFGSLWVQAAKLLRIDPRSGKTRGTLAVAPAYGWEYSLAVGFGSLWVRQNESVVRIDPSPSMRITTR
jgi:streptogramin lyase